MSRYDIADESGETPAPASAPSRPGAKDPARPEAVRGRYILPNPVSGKSKSWQRVTTFVGLAADTYHLDLWKQRCVAKGVALMASEKLMKIQSMDVKGDKVTLDRVVELAKDEAGAFNAANRGTELHASSEVADYAGSWQDPYSILKVHPADRPQIQLYLDTLRMHGLEVAYLDDGTPAIERVTASQRYETAGKLDRVLREADGSYVVSDLKTKDSLELGAAEIAAQLANYEDGINNTGIWDGRTYNRSIRVRTDYGLVIHLPQNGDTCDVVKIDLSTGHEISRVCLEVRQARRVQGKNCMSAYAAPRLSQDDQDAYWLEAGNAARTYEELVAVAGRARAFGQLNNRIAAQFRIIAAHMAGYRP